MRQHRNALHWRYIVHDVPEIYSECIELQSITNAGGDKIETVLLSCTVDKRRRLAQ